MGVETPLKPGAKPSRNRLLLPWTTEVKNDIIDIDAKDTALLQIYSHR